MAAYLQDAIVLFGDSLTQLSWDPQGLATSLAVAYERRLDVINRGFGGYNTRWALPVFEQIFAKKDEKKNVPKVRLMTIWFGANDAALPPSSQHVPIDEFASNLTKLINLVTSSDSPWHSPETKIILITPPPLDPSLRKSNDRSPEVTKQYAEKVLEVGSNKNVPVANIYQAIWDSAGHQESGLPEYLSDGLHLTSEGYKIVYSVVSKAIGAYYPELHHENLPYVLIPWGEVNSQNYKEVTKKRNIFQ